MNRMRLLWRLLTGGDRPTLNDHARRIRALERRTDAVERRQDAIDAFRDFGRRGSEGK
jgi:hypothetical protein